MTKKRKGIAKTCPRCEGDGEEVGAPVEPDGKWLCSRCNGKGYVLIYPKKEKR